MTSPVQFPYLYRWNRQGCKDQSCAVDVRAKVMNSCLVRFPDGYTMVTSRNALARLKDTGAA
ncbi:hypothetical protein FHS76_003492 [Ochrobactrum daejeonense]|uniref:Uncharacterized protein n=1 Tax=Brucella daejeonensis TaxID=659015 RepID=A0A7W9AZQ2_9HYPH|nr:hypothetical protein [Brucella daejeonensis]MBB5703585.1 hypothetical protein [Brucella daejeonensis]